MRKTVANILLLITTTIFCLFSIEFFSRAYFPNWNALWQHQFISLSPQIGTNIGTANFSGIMQDLDDEYKISINLDQNGFRNFNNIETDTFLLGDSFAFGWGVQKPFALLAEEQTQIHIENLALPGGDFIDYYLLAAAFIPKNKVKNLIITITIENDIRKYSNEITKRKEITGTSKFFKTMFEQSAAFNLFATIAKRNNTLLNLGRKLNIFGASQDSNTGDPIQASLEMIRKIKNLTSPERTIIIPIAPRISAEMDILYNQTINALAHEAEILEIPEDQKNTRFKIDGHWNQEGHQVVADLLAKKLLTTSPLH